MSYSEPPPPQYGQPVPPYAGGQPPKKSVMAIIGLVLGIIGAIPCFSGCLIFSIGAIVLSKLAQKEIAQSQGAKTGAGQAKWAFILGLVGLAIGAVYWILVGTGAIDINYSGSVN